MLCIEVMLLWKKETMYGSNVIKEEGYHAWKKCY